MKFLMKYIGGSQLYGLNTPESDVDWRGIFLNTEPAKILRFQTFDSVSRTGESDEDEVYYELWRFFDLLRKTNTQIVESIYIDKDYCEILNPLIEDVLDNPSDFINSDKLVASTKGYSIGEYKLAMGQRTGKLGGKRFEQLQKYGFSPKNVTQMIRLSCGIKYFQDTGVYPLNMKQHMPKEWEMAYEIKTNPENFNKDQVDKICQDCLRDVDKVEDKLGFTFNQEMAIDIMRAAYRPYMF